MDIRKKVTDSLGRNVCVSLFAELKPKAVAFKPIYTLQQAKQIVLDSRDPTEYKAAMELVGDWNHWTELRTHPQIKGHVDAWFKELEMKLKSEAMEAMVAFSKQPGGIAAAKWLHDKGYNTEGGQKKRGRPSNQHEKNDEHVEKKLAHVMSIVRK